jgi:hypothetical protein
MAQLDTQAHRFKRNTLKVRAVPALVRTISPAQEGAERDNIPQYGPKGGEHGPSHNSLDKISLGRCNLYSGIVALVVQSPLGMSDSA